VREPFDRILLDAPCSASGVVRRHPDIKWLRRRPMYPSSAARSGIAGSLMAVLAPMVIVVRHVLGVSRGERRSGDNFFCGTRTLKCFRSRARRE